MNILQRMVFNFHLDKNKLDLPFYKSEHVSLASGKKQCSMKQSESQLLIYLHLRYSCMCCSSPLHVHWRPCWEKPWTPQRSPLLPRLWNRSWRRNHALLTNFLNPKFSIFWWLRWLTFRQSGTIPTQLLWGKKTEARFMQLFVCGHGHCNVPGKSSRAHSAWTTFRGGRSAISAELGVLTRRSICGCEKGEPPKSLKANLQTF